LDLVVLLSARSLAKAVPSSPNHDRSSYPSFLLPENNEEEKKPTKTLRKSTTFTQLAGRIWKPFIFSKDQDGWMDHKKEDTQRDKQ
jgi:hypothetical protein